MKKDARCPGGVQNICKKCDSLYKTQRTFRRKLESLNCFSKTFIDGAVAKLPLIIREKKNNQVVVDWEQQREKLRAKKARYMKDVRAKEKARLEQSIEQNVDDEEPLIWSIPLIYVCNGSTMIFDPHKKHKHNA